jgi:hypothetical protein
MLLTLQEQLDFLNKAINDYNEGKIDEQELSCNKQTEVEFIAGIYGVDISGDLIPYTNDKFIKTTLEDIEEDLTMKDPTLKEPRNKDQLTKAIEEEFFKRKTQATIEALTGLSVELRQQEDQEDQEVNLKKKQKVEE